MHWILTLIFIINIAQGKDCNFLQKGVKAPPPTIPAAIPLEEKWNEAFKEGWRELCSELRGPHTFFPGHRARPGSPFKAAYKWDVVFLSGGWIHWDPSMAENLVHSVFRFAPADERSQEFLPPLLSWISWRIYEKSKNKDFLKAIYPELKRYQEGLLKRHLGKDGLFYWSDPQFSAVDMSSYMALSLDSLSLMALELDLVSDSQIFRQQYTKLRDQVNNRLWDASKGMYFDWDHAKKQFIHLEALSNLMTLAAGIPNETRAKTMLDKILDPFYFNTRIPFPLVVGEGSAQGFTHGRGPSWISMAFLAILGVDRYGHHEVASYLARKLVKGIYDDWKVKGHFPLPVQGLSSTVNALLIEFGRVTPKPYPKGSFSYRVP